MAQAEAARQKSTGSIHEPYDAMRLQARVLRYYNGGVTDIGLEHMSYKRFFGLVRELDIMLAEERESQKTTQRGQNISLDIPRPQEYTGETVSLT